MRISIKILAETHMAFNWEIASESRITFLNYFQKNFHLFILAIEDPWCKDESWLEKPALKIAWNAQQNVLQAAK